MRSIKEELQGSRLRDRLEHQEPGPKCKRSPSSASFQSQARLRAILSLQPEDSDEEIQMVIKEGVRSKTSPQSRGHWLLRNVEFQQWLTVNGSRGLLVDGNSNGSDRISAMSYVCALLIQSLGRVEPVVTLSFFCGLHTLSDHRFGGPQGLLRSLISQLLDVQQFPLDFIDAEYEMRLQDYDLDYLIDLFQHLVKNLADDRVLFCIIDGLSLYDRCRNDNDLDTVVNVLTELTNDDGVGPIFKLLITSPLYNRCAKQYFSPKDHIIVPTNAGNGQMLTVAQVIRHTDKAAIFHEVKLEQVIPEEEESEEEGDYEQGNFGFFGDEAP